MRLLEKLNDHQKEAVLHIDGPLLILAGAGSGKTRVITHRIAYLIKEKMVPPYSIMAVTFTNKAAEEMRNRVVDLIGPTGESVFIKTFHSAAVHILRRYGERAGIPRAFSIYDAKDQETLIKDILIEMRLDPKKIRPASIASKISEVKDRAEMIEGVDISTLLPDSYAFNFNDLYEAYQSRLRAADALDFNDLLIRTVQLLRECPDVLADLQRRWRYLMIDEYQDTNYAQYLICKYLSSAHHNICVVGDDDQSIYSWRGADIRNILNFERDFANAKVITLRTNYRSTTPILAAASCIIKNNEGRKEKNLHSHRGEGEAVEWCRANNEYGEAEFAVSIIQRLKKQEGLKNRDFSIFYRTNAQSRVFEEVMRRENVQYRVVGGLRFYDRKEIKDIVAYLRLIANPRDTVSLMRIINVPARGIGNATIERIRDAAYEQRVGEWELIRQGLPMKGKTPSGLEEFRSFIMKKTGEAPDIGKGLRLSRFVESIVDGSGYRKSLEEENSIENRSRIENIEEFLNGIYDYETANPEAGLDQFLQDISLLTSEESPENVTDAGNSVSLMTVHNAKGLEFTVVFLTGLEEGIFPHANSSDTESGIEEERRLCYVGITRARDRIFLTSAEIRRSYGGIEYRTPSRFIFEIPAEMLHATEYCGAGYGKNAGEGYRTHFGTPAAVARRDAPVEQPAPKATPSGSQFKPRDMILHPRYGRGRVIAIEGSGDNIKLTIQFTSGDKKTFLEKYTPLEKARGNSA